MLHLATLHHLFLIVSKTCLQISKSISEDVFATRTAGCGDLLAQSVPNYNIHSNEDINLNGNISCKTSHCIPTPTCQRPRNCLQNKINSIGARSHQNQEGKSLNTHDLSDFFLEGVPRRLPFSGTSEDDVHCLMSSGSSAASISGVTTAVVSVTYNRNMTAVVVRPMSGVQKEQNAVTVFCPRDKRTYRCVRWSLMSALRSGFLVVLFRFHGILPQTVSLRQEVKIINDDGTMTQRSRFASRFQRRARLKSPPPPLLRSVFA